MIATTSIHTKEKIPIEASRVFLKSRPRKACTAVGNPPKRKSFGNHVIPNQFAQSQMVGGIDPPPIPAAAKYMLATPFKI